MLNLKKTVVAVIALTGGVAFAGSMGPVCSAVNVTVPCESTAWDFGARALYLEPVSTSGVYNYVAQNPNGNFVNYPNNWAWGFMIEGSYHYNTGNDANLNWYHVNRSASKTLSGSLQFPLTTTPANSVGNASSDPKWDAVNLEFGQRVDFGDNKNIRFHGGVEYARAANSISVSMGNGTTYTSSASANPTFNGFGPRLGADMNYDWGNGLGVYANGAGAVLVGTAKTSQSAALTSSSTTFSNYSSNSQTVIAPELEAKLGIKYDYAMAQGDLTLDLGWMWINYFNAQNSTLMLENSFGHVSNDFGLQGLYFGLKWLGNVA
jgi:hypothetical protein